MCVNLYFLLVIMMKLLAAIRADGHVLEHQNLTSEIQILDWSNAAFDWLSKQNCSNPVFTSEKSCNDVKNVSKSGIRIYGATSRSQRLRSVMVDGDGRYFGAHDGVLVLDPFPEAKFGHLVVMFFVDIGFNEARCFSQGGYLSDDGGCLQLVVNQRCRNALGDRLVAKRRTTTGRRCEILFLPLVHFDDEPPRQASNQLRCYDNTAEFHPTCTELRPVSETEHVRCDPLRTNTKTCDTTHHIKTRCHFMKTCDQAVILSGGWNRQLSGKNDLTIIREFHRTLRQNGFEDENIKTFYANGMSGYQDDPTSEDSDNIEMYPSTLKLALRHHLRALCKVRHCTETLIVFLNSPARPDGASLLWDLDSNGEYDDSEVFTVNELLLDLGNCSATRVIVIVDQSFAGELVRSAAKLQRSEGRLSNVAIVASSSASEWSYSNEFSKYWTRVSHQLSCLLDVQNGSKSEVRYSNPTTFFGAKVEGDINPLNSTMSGAPCNTFPLLTIEELKKKYQGCQNLSTWDLMKPKKSV